MMNNNVWVANYYSARNPVEIIKFGDPGSAVCRG